MNSASPSETLIHVPPLVRLCRALYYSLAAYIVETNHESPEASPPLAEAISHIVADERHLAERIATLVADREGRIDLGTYPMQFTDTHFVSLEYLLGDLACEQQGLLVQIDRCRAELADDPAGRALADEARGAATAHFEALGKLARQHPQPRE